MSFRCLEVVGLLVVIRDGTSSLLDCQSSKFFQIFFFLSGRCEDRSGGIRCEVLWVD